MLNDKQKLLFENLKNIKSYWVNTAVENLSSNADLIASNCEEEYQFLAEKLSSVEELLAFQKTQNETIEGVIHSILVMIDGGDDLADKLSLDLIDGETKESLQNDIALHEEFAGYLLDVEDE
ncbi:histidine kinase (plasmid) [Priestia aryabhattai]